MEAIMLPTEDPATILGIRSYSYRALRTPKWNFPNVAPPIGFMQKVNYHLEVKPFFHMSASFLKRIPLFLLN